MTTTEAPHTCDWPGCFTEPATAGELDGHYRGHWAEEDTRNEFLRTRDRYWARNTQPGSAPSASEAV